MSILPPSEDPRGLGQQGQQKVCFLHQVYSLVAELPPDIGNAGDTAKKLDELEVFLDDLLG